MSFDVEIADVAQPATFDVVIGEAEGSLLVIPLPRVTKGTLFLAIVIRNDVISTPEGWTKIANGLGAGTVLADLFVHMVDDSDYRAENEALGEVVFLSLVAQELQGSLLVLENAYPNGVLEASAHVAFAADATPATPASTSQQAVNTVIRAWSSSGAIDIDPPAGYDVHDTYSSAEVAARSLTVATILAGKTGAIDAVDAAASGAATGNGFTFVIRNGPPLTPRELFDPIPGHIGLR